MTREEYITYPAVSASRIKPGKIEGLNEGPLTSEQFYNQTYKQ